MKKSILTAVLCLVFALVLCACNSAGSPKETKAPEIMQKSDPAEDDVFNILMVGHSGCYYFTDELQQMLQSAGVKASVCNVYYSGCSPEQHWTWWKNGEANYEFYVKDASGSSMIEDCDLDFCLEYQNWDVITLMEASKSTRTTPGAEAFAAEEKYITELYAYFAEQYPQSKLYWHHAWVYQVGYDQTEVNGFKVENAEDQAAYAQRRKDFALAVCDKLGVDRIPGGDAWQIMRQKYGYDTLCARMGSNGGKGDDSHDGDIGGGQYLNACVWFETLTGKSCIGNTWRPSYSLSEDLIPMLQQAAHEAVAQLQAG